MGNKKTNIDYLREILEKSENAMDSDDYKEAIEFLDAVQEESDDLKKEVEESKDEIKNFETTIDDKDSEIQNLRDMEPSWKIIRGGIGDIQWQSDSMQLGQLMELLDEKLHSSTPLKIMDALNAL